MDAAGGDERVNASAETVAAPEAAEAAAVQAESSFLWDILGTVQNIGLLVLGVALLMGAVSIPGLHA